MLPAEVRQTAGMFLGQAKPLTVFTQASLKSLLLRVHLASLSTLTGIVHQAEMDSNAQ